MQLGNFRAEADAQPLIDSLEDDYAPRIVREVIREAHGMVELFDADLVETYSLRDGFRLVPALRRRLRHHLRRAHRQRLPL